MALLDFSDIILDPDLNDTFSVIRQTEVVGDNGRAVITEAAPVDNVIGVVTVGDPGNLLRAEDYSTTDNVITISTMYRLRATAHIDAGDVFVQPDIVVWNGARYTVKALKNWNRLGAGFVKAVAVSSRAADAPPT